MDIQIKKQALFKPGSDVHLRKGVIQSLSKIQDANYNLVFDDTLPTPIQKLLENEGLSLQFSSVKDANVIIGTNVDAEKLTIRKTGEQEYLFDSWQELTQFMIFPPRIGSINRKTNETNIDVRVNLDGTGAHQINTGLGFF
jgi:hypothetical protein